MAAETLARVGISYSPPDPQVPLGCPHGTAFWVRFFAQLGTGPIGAEVPDRVRFCAQDGSP